MTRTKKSLPHYSIEVRRVKSSFPQGTHFFFTRKALSKMLRMDFQSSGREQKKEKSKARMIVK